MQDQSPTSPAYDLGHYLRPLQRQRKWLVVAVVTGLVLGLAYTVISKPTYTAAARVNVAPPPATLLQSTANQTGGRTTTTINMDTEAQILKSLPVATLAKAALKTSTHPGALLSRISVSVPANTTILRLACTARSAGVAQTCANAFANAYLANRKDTQAAVLSKQLSQITGLITKAKSAQAADAAQAVTFPKGTPKRDTLFQAAQGEQNTITNTLTPQQSTLQNELGVLSGGNVQQAASLGVSSQTSRGIPPITGLILGLLIGLGIAYGRERFDRHVRHRDDLASAGVELVAEIDADGGPATRTRFDQRIASIVAGSFDADGGIVYVAPISPGQADAGVAAHLASTLASVGHHVELVKPFAVQAVETTEFASADDIEVDDETVQDAAAAALLGWPVSEDGLPPTPSTEVAIAKPTEMAVPKPVEVVLAPTETAADSIPMTIRIQLEMARQRAHFVIVDGDPAVTDSQAYVLAGLSDATLLVVDPRSTTRRDLAEVVDQLSVTGTELLGAVIWRPLRANDPGATGSALPKGRDPRRGKRSETSAAGSPGVRSATERGTGSVRRLNGAGPWLPSRPVDAAR
ncbi:MAG TPA: Wzz/FepE/Etk N-terminal domain-containing protein [Mycobacteriales bacterium]|jgi:capsular polysaccharide biosynthesis protein|nr:Wzz/FepE/Etk N-terminal domain-containing protein [Mycobacteriales bacterium]